MDKRFYHNTVSKDICSSRMAGAAAMGKSCTYILFLPNTMSSHSALIISTANRVADLKPLSLSYLITCGMKSSGMYSVQLQQFSRAVMIHSMCCSEC